MKEQFETMASDHLRVAFAFCAFIIALLTILTVIKKRQQGTLQFNDRGTLWAVAIFILEGTMLCITLGILSPSMHNSPQLLTCILGLVIPGLLTYSAEKIHKSTQTKISEENNHEQVKVEPFTESSDDTEKIIISEESAIAEGAKHVVFTARLNTTLANSIFTKAIKEGYIEEVDGHYINVDNLFNTSQETWVMETRGTRLEKWTDQPRRTFTLSAKYTFNPAKKKYKGEAASSELNRF